MACGSSLEGGDGLPRDRSVSAHLGAFAVAICPAWDHTVGAQLNVMLKHSFYPRSLADVPSTSADRRVLEAYASERTYHPDRHVAVRTRQ